MIKTLPPQERLHELFHYVGGRLIRRVSRGCYPKGQVAGSVDNEGYSYITIDRKVYKLHRVIWKWYYGTEPDVVDHLDNNPTNNNIWNLESVTGLENQRGTRQTRERGFSCYDEEYKSFDRERRRERRANLTEEQKSERRERQRLNTQRWRQRHK